MNIALKNLPKDLGQSLTGVVRQCHRCIRRVPVTSFEEMFEQGSKHEEVFLPVSVACVFITTTCQKKIRNLNFQN